MFGFFPSGNTYGYGTSNPPSGNNTAIGAGSGASALDDKSIIPDGYTKLCDTLELAIPIDGSWEGDIISDCSLDDCCNNVQYNILSNVSNGTLEVVEGNLVYTPNAGFIGQDCAIILIECDIAAYNTYRFVCWEVGRCDGCDDLYIDVAGNETITGQLDCNPFGDCCNGMVTYSLSPDPTHSEGTTATCNSALDNNEPSNESVDGIIVNSDGSYSITPPDKFLGELCFPVYVHCGKSKCYFNICLTVGNCCGDQTYTITADPGAKAAPISEEPPPTCTWDCCHDPVYTVGADPTQGTVTINEDGSWDYNPDDCAWGGDSFTIVTTCYSGKQCYSVINIEMNHCCEDYLLMYTPEDCSGVFTHQLDCNGTDCCKPVYRLEQIPVEYQAYISINDTGLIEFNFPSDFVGEFCFYYVAQCTEKPLCCYGEICITVGDVVPECPDGSILVAGECIQTCTDDADCPDGYTCINGLCLPICTDDADCPEGWVCIGGICFPPCSEDGECPPGFVCVGGYCLPECLDGICPEGFICVDGICLPICSDTSECPPGWLCVNGICLPPCSEGCPEGWICIGGYCYPPCGPDGSCPPGFYCNEDYGACFPECPDGGSGGTGNEDCTFSFVDPTVPRLLGLAQNSCYSESGSFPGGQVTAIVVDGSTYGIATPVNMFSQAPTGAPGECYLQINPNFEAELLTAINTVLGLLSLPAVTAVNATFGNFWPSAGAFSRFELQGLDVVGIDGFSIDEIIADYITNVGGNTVPFDSVALAWLSKSNCPEDGKDQGKNNDVDLTPNSGAEPETQIKSQSKK